MSDNPTATLARTPARISIQFCLATNPKRTDLICTRITDHKTHCCDETAGESWHSTRGEPAVCRARHDHSKEKGLTRR